MTRMRGLTREVLAQFVELLIGRLPALEESPPPILKNGKGDEETIVLVVSDLQAGHKTPSFDAGVLEERLREYGRAVVKIVSLHRKAYPVHHCVMFWIGDNIQNDVVGRYVSLDELEMVVMDQVFGVVVPQMERFFKHLLAHFRTVTVYCVRGNHGSLGKEAAEKTNWDTVVYRIMADRFRQHSRIQFRIADQFYQIAEVRGWKFLLIHGDAIPAGSYGVPLYGVIQRLMRYNSGGVAEPFDYLVLGHFHTYANLDWNDKEVFLNGTFVSDDEWVRKKMGLASSTCQIVFGVHERRGVTFRYKIRLKNANNHYSENQEEASGK